MYNPDYPQSTGSFMANTYQPQATTDMYYYNGMIPGSFGTAPQMDSRRNAVNPFATNMVAPNGYNTMPVQPQQQQLQPFSSYPSGLPTSATPVFNAMVDSRRNQIGAAVANANVTNSWGQTPTLPQPTVSPSPNPFNTQFNYQTGNAMFNALYQNPVMGFDRKTSCWENPYANNIQCTAPNVNWNGYVQQQQMMPTAPQYPVSQYPQASASWLEIAERNWGNANL